jgi:uncharacterized protein (TIGR02996 family)
MTHDAAFLQDIIEHPDDDDLRLIYADWLDEQGQEARAEFVRVQIRIAVLDEELQSSEDCDNPGCDGCKERRTLRRRERELLEAHRQVWTALIPDYVTDAWSLGEPMQPYAYGARVLYRRGFVEEITLSAEDWLTHADVLTKAAPLREVRLTSLPTVVTDVDTSDGTIRQVRLRGRSVSLDCEILSPVAPAVLRRWIKKLLWLEWSPDWFTFHLPDV